MIYYAITGVFIGVMFHMLSLFLKGLKKNHGYNHTIYLSGGKYVGENHGADYRPLLDDIDEWNDTAIRGTTHVTSSFSYVYVRLYQFYTGKTYDACLENTLQIGRVESQGTTAALVLDDPMVSKKHCMLYRRGDQILIQDLESKNHTYVNGCKIEGAVPICHGDQLSLGQSRYQFQCYFQR